MTLSLAKIEKLEFDTVDVLSRMPVTHPDRAKLHQALINLRVQKRKMLAADGSTLRKSSNPQPRGRYLPADSIAAKVMADAARDRQSEELRLGHHHRDEIPDADALTAIKSALAKPISGDRGLIGFLNRRAAAACQ
jgi:hypothetical protein